MKTSFKFLAITAATIILMPAPFATAADIRPIESNKCRYLLSGLIEKGDAEKIEAIVAKNGDGVDAGNSICLNSPGGNYLAGKQLYDAFMADGFATYVRNGDECHSACAIAFLGGSQWGDFRHPSRTMEPGAVVGFHAPYVKLDSGKKYDANYVSALTRAAFGIVSALIKDQESLKISRRFLTDYILFDSEETKPIQTVEDAAHAGISIDTKPKKIPLSPEAITHACETLFGVYGNNFINPDTATSPDFRTEDSEFSKNTSEKIEIENTNWIRISTQHESETPNQTASCAFRVENGANRDTEVILWSNGVAEEPKLENALQTLKTSVPWWYFVPKDTRIVDL
ncbi:hypothetical protein F9K94_21965 [Brucella tritici]|uniref:Uncharacterized protein n=1 Tax=Brucella tritici TaxID=94626 RepID=A0A7V8B100_9HYPH|nr:hypothetical protein [Brucella tritici]KAB2655222.1 hypothetical protein F9K94_21965 [Brucella tritici]